jgi:hypothetical protein
MSDVKFKCERCGQPILVAAENAGRELACPSCEAALTIPKSAAETAKKASGRLKLAVDNQAEPPIPEAVRKTDTPEAPKVRISSGNKAPVAKIVAAPPTAQPNAPAPAAGDSEPAPTPAQVAVLTAEVKLAVVRAARDRLSDPGRWMPGVDAEGNYAYTAKQDGERLAPVEVGSEEATHYSLIGAVLVEFRRHNVTPTASGRTEFLDREIPMAIRRVLGIDPADASQPQTGKAGMDPQLLGISQAQCLEVLDRLAEDYQAQARIGGGADSIAGWEAQGMTIEELMTRVAKNETVTSNEILRATYRALNELDRRVAQLEESATPAKPSPAP